MFLALPLFSDFLSSLFTWLVLKVRVETAVKLLLRLRQYLSVVIRRLQSAAVRELLMQYLINLFVETVAATAEGSLLLLYSLDLLRSPLLILDILTHLIDIHLHRLISRLLPISLFLRIKSGQVEFGLELSGLLLLQYGHGIGFEHHYDFNC